MLVFFFYKNLIPKEYIFELQPLHITIFFRFDLKQP